MEARLASKCALAAQLGVLMARTGSTEAQAGPAGQAGRPRRQSKGHRDYRRFGYPRKIGVHRRE